MAQMMCRSKLGLSQKDFVPHSMYISGSIETRFPSPFHPFFLGG